MYDWHQWCFENLQLPRIWRYNHNYLLLWLSENLRSVWSQSTDYCSEFRCIWLLILQQNLNMSVFYYFRNQQKKHTFVLKDLNEKRILNWEFYIESKLQAFSFLFTKKMFHQTFSELNSYHSIRAMLANLQFSYSWPKGMPGKYAVSTTCPTTYLCFLWFL